MAEEHRSTDPCDALVLFGLTGDLARKKIFPALYAMAKGDNLPARVIGVASTAMSKEQLRQRITESVRQMGTVDDEGALERLVALVTYVAGDYKNPETFVRLGQALGGARRPAYYLAIPPVLFTTVLQALETAKLNTGGRVIIEKPFGRDLESARQLNRVACAVFAEDRIYRIDHFVAMEAVMNLLYFRFANPTMEPVWNHHFIDSVQISLSETFGVEGRGAFYETAGCLRDVVQNHLFQIMALLAMEQPADHTHSCIHAEKARVMKAVEPIRADQLVRGQYLGYRHEHHVDPQSDVETYCALRLKINTERWAGVPWFLRSGKYMAQDKAEVLIRFKPPSPALFDTQEPGVSPSSYLRFRLSPQCGVGLGARMKRPGKAYAGIRRELTSLEKDMNEKHAPYERLLTDAMLGDRGLFTSEATIEAAWAAVEPVLNRHRPCEPYEKGSWGPKAADALIAEHGGWDNSAPEAETS
jgi:glucose-6-phosphate 1-dehydrogenase